MAHALSGTAARVLILERGDFVPQEDENWNPEAVWKHLRYQTKERWIDEQGQRIPAVYALQRRRKHEVLGQRAVPAPARRFSGGRAHGGHLAGMADRLRHARAVLRARRAPLPRAWRAWCRPDRARRGAFPHRADSAFRRDGRDRRAAALAGPAPVAAAARHPRRLHSLQYVQLVRVQAAREERGRRLLRPRPRSSSRMWSSGPTPTPNG